MKKLLVFAAILALGASVYAYGPGYGMGYKMGNGMGYQGNFGPGNCPGYGGFGMGPRGMKGFKGPRGTIYFADVVDASGNKFQFRLNPFGQVVGPFKTNN
jgi:hypothetical protein